MRTVGKWGGEAAFEELVRLTSDGSASRFELEALRLLWEGLKGSSPADVPFRGRFRVVFDGWRDPTVFPTLLAARVMACGWTFMPGRRAEVIQEENGVRKVVATFESACSGAAQGAQLARPEQN
jgi:hypothetical protein